MNPVKSLKAQKSELGESAFQLKVLNDEHRLGQKIPLFKGTIFVSIKTNKVGSFPNKCWQNV
jgi:hypothetical protein